MPSRITIHCVLRAQPWCGTPMPQCVILLGSIWMGRDIILDMSLFWPTRLAVADKAGPERQAYSCKTEQYHPLQVVYMSCG
jgi:hypothetical protein